MSLCAELYCAIESPDGHGYQITVENRRRGFVRLNVARLKPNSEQASLGANITPAECRALANSLLAAAGLCEGENS